MIQAVDGGAAALALEAVGAGHRYHAAGLALQRDDADRVRHVPHRGVDRSVGGGGEPGGVDDQLRGAAGAGDHAGIERPHQRAGAGRGIDAHNRHRHRRALGHDRHPRRAGLRHSADVTELGAAAHDHRAGRGVLDLAGEERALAAVEIDAEDCALVVELRPGLDRDDEPIAVDEAVADAREARAAADGRSRAEGPARDPARTTAARILSNPSSPRRTSSP